MSAIDKALKTTHSYELTNEECMALMGAIDYRTRFIKGIIAESTKPEIAAVARIELNRLEHVLEKLGF